MTDIYSYQKKRKEDFKKSEKTTAEQLFLDNIGHIETIKETKGFKMIKSYWVSEGNKSLQQLSSIDINDTANLAKTTAKLELATNFVNYLNAHEKGLS
jgi:hypothetical protein